METALEPQAPEAADMPQSAVAVRGLSAPAAVNVAAETVSDNGGYAATAHVRQYYKTTKL